MWRSWIERLLWARTIRARSQVRLWSFSHTGHSRCLAVVLRCNINAKHLECPVWGKKITAWAQFTFYSFMKITASVFDIVNCKGQIYKTQLIVDFFNRTITTKNSGERDRGSSSSKLLRPSPKLIRPSLKLIRPRLKLQHKGCKS